MADTRQRTPRGRLTQPDLPAGLTARRSLAAAVAVGLIALVVALLAGGGAPQPPIAGLPDAGAGTGWALPISRFLTDVSGVLTVGLLLTAALLLPSKQGRLAGVSVRLTAWASYAAGTWVVVTAAQIVLTLSDELGQPVSAALNGAQLRSFVLQIAQGQALLAQLVIALVVTGCCRFLVSTSSTAATMLVAISGLLAPALTGHSGASSEHEVAVSSLMVHLIAASLWVGGLAGLVAVSYLDRRLLRNAVPRFSTLALWCLVALTVSGIANAWIRLLSPLDLVTTGYGRLVAAKSVLLVALGVAGWWHRRITIPQLTGPRRAGAFVRLALAELALMSMAVGIAVALSRSPTPVVPPADLSGASAARLVLGFDLPPVPTPLRLLVTEARPDVFFLAVAGLMAALYFAGLRRLRIRGDAWPVGRSLAWFGGVALIIWATSGGIGTYARVLFSVHMIQHMLLATMAPVLLVLGAPSTHALRVLQARRGDPGPREWLVAFLHSRYVAFFANPLVAAPLFVAGFYGLYFTPLFGALMGSHWGHILMQSHFLISGYLFFWALIGIDPGPRRLPYLGRLVVHLLVMPLHAFFNIAILSSTTLLAGSYFESLHRPYLTDLLADQHLGAGIGWAMGELPMLAVVIAIGVQWMRSDEREAGRFDRRADRAAAGDPEVEDELAVYNRRLQALHTRDEQAAADHPD